MSNIVEVRLCDIIIDPRINTRTLDEEVVQEYVSSMQLLDRPYWQEHWGALPKITKSMHLWSGFHTLEAARRQWHHNCHVRCIQQGETERDAFFLATGENHMHGRRRNSDEKRAAVLRWLQDDEMKEWSDNHIAQQCHVSVMFVGRMSDELLKFGNYTRPHKRKSLRNGALIWIDVRGIGKSGTSAEEPDDAPILTEAMKAEEKPEDKERAASELAIQIQEKVDEIDNRWTPHKPLPDLPKNKQYHPKVIEARKNYFRVKADYNTATAGEMCDPKELEHSLGELDRVITIFEDAYEYHRLQDKIYRILDEFRKRWVNGDYPEEEFPFGTFCDACAETFMLPNDIFEHQWDIVFKLDREELSERVQLLEQGLDAYDNNDQPLEQPPDEPEEVTAEEVSTSDFDLESIGPGDMGYNKKLQHYINKCFDRIEKRFEAFQPYSQLDPASVFRKRNMVGRLNDAQLEWDGIIRADKYHKIDALEPFLAKLRELEADAKGMTPTFLAEPEPEEETPAEDSGVARLPDDRLPTVEEMMAYKKANLKCGTLLTKLVELVNAGDFGKARSCQQDLALSTWQADQAYKKIVNAFHPDFWKLDNEIGNVAQAECEKALEHTYKGETREAQAVLRDLIDKLRPLTKED